MMNDEPYKTPTVEKRLLQIEHEIGLIAGPGNPLAQGLSAKMRRHIDPLVQSIVNVSARTRSLEDRLDEVVVAMNQLKRSAFRRKKP
jgi:hypothetical protein